MRPRCAARSPTGGAGLQTDDDASPAPTANATLGADGLAVAPAGAPPEVVAVIAAANEIVGKPYKYGGGHGDWEDSGYDCSGAESYALNGAGLVSRPLNSTEFMSWGEAGRGAVDHELRHTAGIPTSWSPACDSTRATTAAGSGPRWSEKMRPADGFTARHPEGL